jgi:predicted hydrocarbon binding protein
MKKLLLFYDETCGEVLFHNINCIIVNRSYQAVIQQEIENILGPVTKSLLYEGSKKSARNMFLELLCSNTQKQTEIDNVHFVFTLLPKLGYGLVELIYLCKETCEITVRIRNCFNAEGYIKSETPVCSSMAGILAGSLEAVFKKGMDCEEVKCKSMGSPFCEFRITPGTSFGFEDYLDYYPDPQRKVNNLIKFPILYDETEGVLIFERTRSIATVRGQRARYLQEFENIIGPPARTIIYNVSKSAAIEAVSNVKRCLIWFIGLVSKKLLIKELLKQLPRRGFGVPTLVTVNSQKPFVKIRVENCYGTIGFHNRPTPACYTLAGTFAGAGEVIFGKKLSCTETKCLAMGDNFCEFEIEKS